MEALLRRGKGAYWKTQIISNNSNGLNPFLYTMSTRVSSTSLNSSALQIWGLSAQILVFNAWSTNKITSRQPPSIANRINAWRSFKFEKAHCHFGHGQMGFERLGRLSGIE
jgi:hypothetical protein